MTSLCIAILTMLDANANAQANHQKRSWLLYPDSGYDKTSKELKIKTFEDNLIGYTKDSDDEPFMDFSLSLVYRLDPFDRLKKLARKIPKVGKIFEQNIQLDFAFTGRFAQYIGTRYSSPVVGKRFNPYLFLEYSPKKKHINTKYRFGYGHESNGQSIDDAVTFYANAAHAKVKNSNDGINETIDYISRGWDYFGASYIGDIFPKENKVIYETEVSIRYYLDNGLLQGPKEEYRDWEYNWYGADLKRNEVGGLSASFTCFIPDFRVFKVKGYFETGLAKPFAYNSIKLLMGVRILYLPMAITYSYGYNGDLAQYGKKNSSLGITLILASFDTPFDKTLVSRLMNQLRKYKT